MASRRRGGWNGGISFFFFVGFGDFVLVLVDLERVDKQVFPVLDLSNDAEDLLVILLLIELSAQALETSLRDFIDRLYKVPQLGLLSLFMPYGWNDFIDCGGLVCFYILGVDLVGDTITVGDCKRHCAAGV